MKKLKIKQKSNRSGFTLVELVIVIAIVIILSVISVPIYRGYVDKAKYAEGYALIGMIVSAQKAYYSEYGNFLDDYQCSAKGFWTSYETILGVDARGNKYFTRFYFDNPGNGGPAGKYKTDVYAALPAELQFDDKKSLYLGFNITTGGNVSFSTVSNWG